MHNVCDILKDIKTMDDFLDDEQLGNTHYILHSPNWDARVPPTIADEIRNIEQTSARLLY
jgi:hypothetical protein